MTKSIKVWVLVDEKDNAINDARLNAPRLFTTPIEVKKFRKEMEGLIPVFSKRLQVKQARLIIDE